MINLRIYFPDVKHKVKYVKHAKLPKNFLTGVVQVEEPIYILALFVEVSNGDRQCRHVPVGCVHEEGLPVTEGQPVPDNGGELRHAQLHGHQELHLVHGRQGLLLLVLLHYDGDLGGEVVPDGFHLHLSLCQALPLLESLVFRV